MGDIGNQVMNNSSSTFSTSSLDSKLSSSSLTFVNHDKKKFKSGLSAALSASSNTTTLAEGPLIMPKPQRSNIDLFNLVTEHLKSSPSPPIRQSNSSLIRSSFEHTTGNPNTQGPNDSIIEGYNRNDSITPLEECMTSPFLGEQLSVQEGAHPAFYSRPSFNKITRAQSLEGLASIVTKAPCLQKMPPSRAFSELGDAYEAIPIHSWMFPYILACCPPAMLSQLLLLPTLFQEDNNDIISQTEEGLARPRLASDNDGEIRHKTTSDLPSLGSFYQHKSFSSRPPFANAGIAEQQVSKTTPSPKPMIEQPTSVGEVITQSRSNSPAISSFSFPGSWISLGTLYLSKDPSWRPWEQKIVFLLDNYLFECTLDGTNIIGFCHLSNCTIKRVTQRVTRGLKPIKGAVPSASLSLDTIEVLLISCYANSNMISSQKHEFWITAPSLHDLDVIHSILNYASKLSIQDIYEFPSLTDDKSVLGRGRFNEVRLAKRKAFRYKKFKHIVDEEAIDLTSIVLMRTMNSGSPRSPGGGSFPRNESEGSMYFSYSLSMSNSLSNMSHFNTGTSVKNDNNGLALTDSSPELPPDEQSMFGEFDPASLENSPNNHIKSAKKIVKSKLFSVVEEIDQETLESKSPSPFLPSSSSSSTSLCALKLISKEIFWEKVENGKERGDALIREVLAQLLLSNQSLFGFNSLNTSSSSANLIYNHSDSNNSPFVLIYGIFESPNGFALELELMESYDLFDKLSSEGVMNEHKTRLIIAQVVEAVSLCNKFGIAHRDIKLSNITFPPKKLSLALLSSQLPPSSSSDRTKIDCSSGTQTPDFSELSDSSRSNVPAGFDSENLLIKLADFGMAGFVGLDKRLRGRCGTPGYVAPEILKAGINESYGINVDIFSVCFLYFHNY